jgi:hypothetical protein
MCQDRPDHSAENMERCLRSRLHALRPLPAAFFQSGHYILFFYAFILPVLMIVRFFRDRSAFQARQSAATVQGPPPGYGQPAYGQPGYGQPSVDQPQGPVQ